MKQLTYKINNANNSIQSKKKIELKNLKKKERERKMKYLYIKSKMNE